MGSTPSVVSKRECIMVLANIGHRIYDPEDGKQIAEIGKQIMAELSIFPRRNRLDLLTPAELAIHNAMMEVEKAGASIELTHAIIKLQEARTHVANHVDEKLKEQHDNPE